MRLISRLVLFAAVIFLAKASEAQTIQGLVVDSLSQEPLMYCHIKYIGQEGGALTNEDGEFEVQSTPGLDTITVSYIGYQTKSIAIHQLEFNGEIQLAPQSIELGEVSILGEDEYLYKAIGKCRKVMQRQPSQTSKAYFHLETMTRDVPLEMMQCYYNATTKGCRVTDLELKNARAGLPKFEGGGYYVSLNTTKAIAQLNLTDPDGDFPMNPLQLSRSNCKEEYDLVRLPSFSDVNTLHIAFTPKNNRGIHFEGELWMDKESFHLLKVILTCEDARIYPFSMIEESTKIDRLDFRVTQTYETIGQRVYLDHVDFSYDLSMELWDADYVNRLKLRTQGLLYFYDKTGRFILPLFEYDPAYNDYNKISFIPYDEQFWEESWGFKFSALQLQRMGFLQREGVLLNFARVIEDGGVWNTSDALWSDSSRISPSWQASSQWSDVNPIAVQLLLDPNTKPDGSYRFTSAAIFTGSKFWCAVENPSQYRAYANIYFDVAEIHRRKLENTLNGIELNETLIEEIYKDAMQQLEKDITRLQRETRNGESARKLREWNIMIEKELGIDNLALVGLTQ